MNPDWNCGQLITPLTAQRLHLATHDHILAIKNPLKYRDLWQKSPTTLVWRYGFWKSVHAGLWSWQLGCHHINYEQDWSCLTHISIFWLYSGVFLCFFWARYDFQRLCWSSRSSNETKWMPSAASAHPILGWVGQVWVLSVMNFMNRARERRQSKIAKNRP